MQHLGLDFLDVRDEPALVSKLPEVADDMLNAAKRDGPASFGRPEFSLGYVNKLRELKERIERELASETA